MLTMQQNWIDRSVVAVGSLEPLERLRAKIKSGRPIVYGSIGGSITEGAKADTAEGRYANLIAAHIGAKLVNAGIGASGSLFGCYRAKNDLLKYNPDFITIEYAVNDHAGEDVQPGFEGLVRQCLALPTKPLVLLIFTMEENGHNVQDLHIPVGNHYQLPMISYRDASPIATRFIRKSPPAVSHGATSRRTKSIRIKTAIVSSRSLSAIFWTPPPRRFMSNRFQNRYLRIRSAMRRDASWTPHRSPSCKTTDGRPAPIAAATRPSRRTSPEPF